MKVPAILKKSRKEVTPTQKKAKLTTRVFAVLNTQRSLDKIVEKATELIEGNNLVGTDKLDGFVAGTNAIAKILPYILPKQSDGNSLQVQINNNLIAGETTKDGKTVITLQELLKSRGLGGDNESADVEYTEVRQENSGE